MRHESPAVDVPNADATAGNRDAAVTVIVPAYNRASTIAVCLDSIQRQSYSQWQAIVVDDASTDRTPEVVRDIARQDPRVRLCRLDKHRGAQAARNVGIREADTQWVAFLDSDDQYLPQSLASRLEVARDESVRVVHSECTVITADGHVRPYHVRPLSGNVYERLLDDEGPLFQGLLVHKQCFEAIGYLDERIVAFQEWESALRLAKRFRFGFQPEPTFLYDCRGGDTISKDLRRGGCGYEQVVRKHAAAIVWRRGPRAMARHLRIAADWYARGGDALAAARCVRSARRWSCLDPVAVRHKAQQAFAAAWSSVASHTTRGSGS